MAMATRSPSGPDRGARLHTVVAELTKHHGRVAPPPATTAFALVLWEKVAYLATDEKRAAAFEALRKRVGLTPDAILEAKPAVLREIVTLGGIVGVNERVQHMQDAAAYVADTFDGDLDRVLSLPLPAARKALRKIYGIAEPGADRILLLAALRGMLSGSAMRLSHTKGNLIPTQ
jgi:hypothetical protein